MSNSRSARSSQSNTSNKRTSLSKGKSRYDELVTQRIYPKHKKLNIVRPIDIIDENKKKFQKKHSDIFAPPQKDQIINEFNEGMSQARSNKKKK